ncbi:MAG: transposase [Candidatus Riflebacteria bacterium]|nr:transposase [Candidatus Riflebacteria bacterium]
MPNFHQNFKQIIISTTRKMFNVGPPAFNPKPLLKLILLAYSRGITSSRKIEQMCNENILFMAMTCDQNFDHSTIAAFVSSVAPYFERLFLGVLLICEEMS